MSGRIRTIKPERLDSETLGSLSDAAFRLSEGLILLADDYGNGRASPRLFKARVWAFRDDVTADMAWAAFVELVGCGYAQLYEVDGQRFFHLPKWKIHQRIEKPSKPLVSGPESGAFVSTGTSGDTIPGPVEAKPAKAPEHSPTIRPPLPEHSPTIPGVLTEQSANPPASRVRAFHDHDHDHEVDHKKQPLAGQLPLGGPETSDQPNTAAPGGAGPVREVFEVYLEGWRKHVGKGVEPQLTDARRGRIRARLKEHSVDVLKRAAAGIWLSSWHVENAQTAFDLVVRDTQHVERFATEPNGKPQTHQQRRTHLQPTAAQFGEDGGYKNG